MNCDNYYTSPKTFIELQKNGIFARGTCWPRQKMFPLCVQYTRSEARHSGRRSIKVAVNEDDQLVAMGWVDGNPVNFLTTADGTAIKTVRRQVGSERRQYNAPELIPRYHHGMQGVDRFDQYIALFSMARRHCFKKYYNKLTMGLIDFALVNAELHYYLANPHIKTMPNHWNTFCDKLADQLHTTEWCNFESEDFLVTPTDETNDNPPMPPTVAKTRINRGFAMAPNVDMRGTGMDDTISMSDCNPISVAAFLKKNNSKGIGLTYGGTACQVCMYEGRTRKSLHVVICDHGLRCCAARRHEKVKPTKFVELIGKAKLGELDSWLCPN